MSGGYEGLSLGKPPNVERRKSTREPSGAITRKIASSKESRSHIWVLWGGTLKQTIDQNGDGLIDERDLREMYASLGQSVTDSTLATLLERSNTSPPSINFTLFLTLMSEKLLKLDPSDELLEAFACFDENDSGFIKAEDLHYWLGSVGDKMTTSEIDKLVKGPPYVDRKGNFNYREFVQSLRVNGQEHDEK